jgi:hypothetical protein
VISLASNGNEIQLPKTKEEAIEIIQGKWKKCLRFETKSLIPIFFTLMHFWWPFVQQYGPVNTPLNLTNLT